MIVGHHSTRRRTLEIGSPRSLRHVSISPSPQPQPGYPDRSSRAARGGRIPRGRGEVEVPAVARALRVARPRRARGRALHRAARGPLRRGGDVLQRAVARPAADDRLRDRRVRAALPSPTCSPSSRTRSPRPCPERWARRSTASSTRPSARPATVGVVRPARRAVLRDRLDDEPARRALGAVGAGARAAAAREAGAGRPAVAARAGARAGRLVRGHGPGAGFAATVLAFLGLAEQAWAKVLLALLGVVLGIAANWLIFLWVIARLPREDVALRSAVRGGAAGRGRVRGAQAGDDVLPARRSPSRPAARCSARSSACSCSCTSCRGSCCS